MARAKANGIEVEYETFGEASDAPLLLIIGFSGQMIWWDDELCRELARRGHHVIRYDNRDAGLSMKFDSAGVPDFRVIFGKLMKGEKVSVPYSLLDMADDAAGLLDALGIGRAHICGMSMGGMIAQTMAIRHPARVRSLISIYSTTGNPELPKPTPEAMKVMMTPPPGDRAGFIEYQMGVRKVLSGPGFPIDEAWVRALMARSFDRCFCPQGTGRQFLAILTQADRRPALAAVKAPTLVIHGTDDPLVPVEAGQDTARAIPGSELLLIEGMGHDIPHGGAWPRIVEAIAEHTKKTGC
ncbi:MAG: alpha/beta fold hydrolase [Deltaproteobacteria bacterium]|nr:alpha/beta fold hydrolase [Deltaproteobacteria bacterium]